MNIIQHVVMMAVNHHVPNLVSEKEIGCKLKKAIIPVYRLVQLVLAFACQDIFVFLGLDLVLNQINAVSIVL